MKILSRASAGFTLIEVVTTIMVMSGALLGLFYGFDNFIFRYRQDRVINNIQEYGRLTMNLITEELSQSIELFEPTTFNNFGRIDYLHYDIETGQVESRKVYCRRNRGVLINGEPLMGGDLRLPNYGSNVDGGLRDVTLKDFIVEYDQDIGRSHPKLANSYLNLELILELETNVGPMASRGASNNSQLFHFRRSIFVPNKFIGRRIKQVAGLNPGATP